MGLAHNQEFVGNGSVLGSQTAKQFEHKNDHELNQEHPQFDVSVRQLKASRRSIFGWQFDAALNDDLRWIGERPGHPDLVLAFIYEAKPVGISARWDSGGRGTGVVAPAHTIPDMAAGPKDGPQNQIESKPGIEAGVLESATVKA